MGLDRYLTAAPAVNQATAVGEYNAMMATLTPATALIGRNTTLPRDEKWQTRARKYDREGPGIVGASLDLPAATSTLAVPYVAVYDNCEWNRSEDPMLKVILRMFRGRDIDQPELIRRLIRTCDGPAEGYLINRRDSVGWFTQLAQTTNVNSTQQGLEVRTRPNAQAGSRFHTVVEPQFANHFLMPDPEWEDQAWSALRRGLPDLELYRSACRVMGRNLDSQLAMNGIMWSQAVVGGSKWIDHYQSWAKRGMSSDDGIEAVAPFPMSTAGDAPQWIDVGRKDHSDQMAVADKALMGFARAMDTPTRMLIEGPGTGTHWSDFILNDAYADFTMSPRLAKAANLITCSHMRPWINALPSLRRQYPDPAKVRVEFDDVRIRTKTDNTDRIFKLREMGIATREAAAIAGGLDPDQIIDLPAEVTEYEDWVLSRSPTPAHLQAVEDDDEPTDGIRPGMTASNPGEPMRASLDVVATEPYWNELTPA